MAAINRRILQVIRASECWRWAGTTGIQVLFARTWLAVFALRVMGFATVLIAVKPVKLCDRGVLWAFYLLPKTERM